MIPCQGKATGPAETLSQSVYNRDTDREETEKEGHVRPGTQLQKQVLDGMEQLCQPESYINK